MTDNDRYTNPKDNARHLVESLTIPSPPPSVSQVKKP